MEIHLQHMTKTIHSVGTIGSIMHFMHAKKPMCHYN
jgi:hypothetical protein